MSQNLTGPSQQKSRLIRADQAPRTLMALRQRQMVILADNPLPPQKGNPRVSPELS